MSGGVLVVVGSISRTGSMVVVGFLEEVSASLSGIEMITMGATCAILITPKIPKSRK